MRLPNEYPLAVHQYREMSSLLLSTNVVVNSLFHGHAIRIEYDIATT